MKTIGVLAALGIALLCTAPTATAHPAYWSTGPAVGAGSLFRIDVYRFLDFEGIKFDVRLTDPVTNLIVHEARFLASDNYIDENTDVALPYVADAGISGVDFHIEGYQSASWVFAHGHYLDYQIVVAPNQGM